MSAILRIESPDASGVAVLTLHRPDKRNALSIALRDEISDALDALAADPSAKVVIVTGAGETFSAGFDLAEFRIEEPRFQKQLWESSDRFHHTVLAFSLPAVAAVNGPAIAGGFDLAVMCDLRVASETAWFSHPERTFGDVVYSPLHDLVGAAVARELCYTGRRVDASEALALRVVNAVAPDALEEARRVAAMIAEAPRDVLIRLKAKAIRRAGIAGETGTLDL
jgi:enoyl-CoA hydratase